MLLSGSHNHCLDDLALLDVAARDGVFDRTDDDVADARIPATGSADNTGAKEILCIRVLSATLSRDSCWIISDYFAFSTISTRRQRLVALSGRVSITRTRSPTAAAFCSSCAFSRLVWRSTLP